MHVGLLTLHHRGYLRSFKGILGIAVYDLYQLSSNLIILLDLNCGNGGRDEGLRLDNIYNWNLDRVNFGRLARFSSDEFVDDYAGSLGIVCEDRNCCRLALSRYDHRIDARHGDSWILLNESIKHYLGLGIALSYSLNLV